MSFVLAERTTSQASALPSVNVQHRETDQRFGQSDLPEHLVALHAARTTSIEQNMCLLLCIIIIFGDIWWRRKIFVVNDQIF